jgi:hypothetical protein
MKKMPEGIYLKQLHVLGPNKKPAILNMSKGLNVLSGASDTGKSYVFQCIDFILGAGNSPKEVEEAEGYKEVRAEFSTYNNKRFTLSRMFKEKVIYLAESSINEFSKNNTIKLSAKHSSKNDENISSYLLDILGMKGKKLKKNNRNEKKELSFRLLSRFCLIDEEKIISESSPIYSGQRTDTTSEDALFRLILSGKDDDELETFDDPQVIKNRISGKIEYIQETIKRNNLRLEELQKSISIAQNYELNIQIEELTEAVSMANQNVVEEEKKRQEIWSEIEKLNSRIIQIRELKERFNVLDKHYISDINRLEFINEGSQLLGQLKDVNCPICGSLVQQENMEHYHHQHKNIEDSLQAENNKIKKKRKELQKTVESLQEEEDSLIIQISDLKNKFDTINQFIINKLKPVYNVNKEKLEEFLKLKNEQKEFEITKSEIERQEREIHYYEQKLKEKQKTGKQIVLSNDIYDGLANDVKEILNGWGIICESVEFIKKDNDIEINGKARKNYGKGYRAVFLSAFMIAILQYCIENDLHHPQFLILDSPLVAYKEKDTSEEDKIQEEIQDKFFESLSKLKYIDKTQIIVIENKTPPNNIEINHIHFTGNKEINRYGFFPV